VRLLAKRERLFDGKRRDNGVTLLDDVVAEVAVLLVAVEDIGVLEGRESRDSRFGLVGGLGLLQRGRSNGRGFDCDRKD
jgi:hypothetical protein